jgi:hypothetical protein
MFSAAFKRPREEDGEAGFGEHGTKVSLALSLAFAFVLSSLTALI